MRPLHHQNLQKKCCAVCGELVICSDLIHISNLDSNLNHLTADGYGFTHLERKVPSDPISELDGPIVDQNFPGKLSLCIGMPVMLRNNDATELCITKGQEGTVAGWQSCVGPHGKLVLDTLFVRLENPPHMVKFDGLPENVVPIAKMSQTIECTMKSDQIRMVEREQCCVLPNFSMTDYASQGKTRPYNPVDLQHSNSHQSYYTCLSRCASAKGTLIMQSLQPSMITGGCSGWLRQEFRDLEILDEITRLAFHSQLVPEINGHC